MTSSPRARRSPPLPDEDLGLVDALVQSSFLVQELLTELGSEHDLSMTQVRLLGVLRDREPRMAELARLLALSKPSASGLVDRAERRGLLRRIDIDVGDGRAVHVSLSDEGRELARAVSVEIGARLAGLAAGLADTDRARLSALLSHIVFRSAALHNTDLRPTTLKESTR